jgi:hypothetical protein
MPVAASGRAEGKVWRDQRPDGVVEEVDVGED